MLRAGRHDGRVPVRVRAGHGHAAHDALRPLRRPRGQQRTDAPGAARCGHAQGLSAPQARRRTGVVRAAGTRADPRAHVRRHHLSGTGDAHRADSGRHFARRSGCTAKGGGQEGRRAHQTGAWQVHREVHRARLRPQDHRGTRRPDRDVRALRIQQVTLGRILRRFVSDGVAEGALSRRLHGGNSLLGHRRHGFGGEVHQRGT